MTVVTALDSHLPKAASHLLPSEYDIWAHSGLADIGYGITYVQFTQSYVNSITAVIVGAFDRVGIYSYILNCFTGS